MVTKHPKTGPLSLEGEPFPLNPGSYGGLHSPDTHLNAPQEDAGPVPALEKEICNRIIKLNHQPRGRKMGEAGLSLAHFDSPYTSQWCFHANCEYLKSFHVFCSTQLINVQMPVDQCSHLSEMISNDEDEMLKFWKIFTWGIIYSRKKEQMKTEWREGTFGICVVCQRFRSVCFSVLEMLRNISVLPAAAEAISSKTRKRRDRSWWTETEKREVLEFQNQLRADLVSPHFLSKASLSSPPWWWKHNKHTAPGSGEGPGYFCLGGDKRQDKMADCRHALIY